MIMESGGRPPLPYFPFLIIAVTWFLVSLGFLALGFGYGPAAIPISALLAAPPAIAWLRPMIGWILALVTLPLLLPADRLIFGDSLEPMFWYAGLLAAQLPVSTRSPSRPADRSTSQRWRSCSWLGWPGRTTPASASPTSNSARRCGPWP
ncbi:hypothetical protein [Microlunatus parietis]|uniref:Uncharacterized protein n=1 Tax=Microlunatus parietis TaxID=682979 RepID=A0A7Y9I5W1_9ACTN|nr:hypothetical protein [Microlunatus parietis]NYE70865.1 hypothetical protein [Microlunatus parietis]